MCEWDKFTVILELYPDNRVFRIKNILFARNSYNWEAGCVDKFRLRNYRMDLDEIWYGGFTPDITGGIWSWFVLVEYDHYFTVSLNWTIYVFWKLFYAH
jgi:hypothetical protein